jgi:F420-non-reducing hydrogenase small subunit
VRSRPEESTVSQGEDLFGITFEKGQPVFSQGDMGDTMYVIQSGAVEISQSQNGAKTVLALLERGGFFGEMALVDNHPRSASATAISRCRLLPLTRSSLTERIRRDPGVVVHLLRTLCERINDTNLTLKARVQNDERLRFILESGRRETERTSEQAVNDQPAGQDAVSPDKQGMSRPFDKPSEPRDSELPMANLSINPRECSSFRTGQTIFDQGDPGDSMFIIIDGGVEISQGADQDKYVLALLGPGDFFGETAVITEQLRSARASASKQTFLLPINRTDFLERIQREPELALYILQGLIIRLRKMLTVLTSPEKSVSSMVNNLPPPLRKRSRVRTAIISLSTCGGCAATFLEDQAALVGLLEKVKISYCPMLIDKAEIGEVEVALVDGMVRVKEDEEKLIEARRKSRYLLAWGTCASFGGIPAFANQYELEDLIKESFGQTKDAFAYYLSGTRGIDRATFQEQDNELRLLRRAGKLDEFVRVDYYLPGCPPKVDILVQFLNELKGEGEVSKPKTIVCSECSRKHVKMPTDYFWVSPRPQWDSGHCFTSRGSICMGFITKGGCGAICPQGGLPCWGCRGPSETALKKMQDGNSFDEFILNSLVNRHQHLEDQIKSAIRIFRKHGNSSLKFNRNFVLDRSRIR